MTKSLGQAYSIQTFDQQLYAIAKQVEWDKQDTFKTHILRLGGFKIEAKPGQETTCLYVLLKYHFLCTTQRKLIATVRIRLHILASIGKLWGDSGLKDLLIESSVYAAGSVEQMMTGKQFNSAVRALPLVYEALSSLWLSAFFEWCRENDIFMLLSYSALISDFLLTINNENFVCN
jgi:hypothetical protein